MEITHRFRMRRDADGEGERKTKHKTTQYNVTEMEKDIEG